MEDSAIEKRRNTMTPIKEIQSPSFLLCEDADLLENETFDFDLPVSPGDGPATKQSNPCNEDDDEIFIGPVGLREKCVAKVVEETEKTIEACRPLSPLPADLQVQLFVEAHKVAAMLKSQNEKDSSTKKPVRKSPRIANMSSPKPKEAVKRKKGLLSWDSPNISDTVDADKVLKDIGVKLISTHNEFEDKVTEMPKKKLCRNILKDASISDNEKENENNKPKIVQRSHSLRGSGLPQFGLKQPVVRKRQRTSSESSPGNVSLNSTFDADKPKNIEQKSKLQRLKAPSADVRKSPRLSIQNNSMNKSPTKNSLRPSNLQGLQKKASGLAAPSKSKLAAPASKPSLMPKGPIAKLELIKPSTTMQKKALATNRSKLVKPGSSIPGSGPMKAKGPVKAGEKTLNKSLNKSLNTSIKVSPPSTLKAPHKQPILSTPVKQERVIAPKKLLAEENQFCTPKKSDSSGSTSSCTFGTPQSVSQSAKRRSFLPTPGRKGSASSCASSLFRSSASSTSSVVDSPAYKLHQSPAVGMGNRPKVLHTPHLKEIAQPRKQTGWTPVRRQKPIAPEDEFYLCTKHKK